MKPLTSTQISGTWGTTLLPINKDESIDFGRLSQDLDYLLTSGVDGIYTNGTAGEFYAQTEERVRPDKIPWWQRSARVPACHSKLARAT